MAFKSGIVPVGPTATKVYDPVATGFIVLQLVGTIAAQCGGPGVTFNGVNGGVALPVGAAAGVGGLPTSFPIAHYGELADADDAIYAVSSAGTVSVAYVANT